jgi:hypothetical protein
MKASDRLLSALRSIEHLRGCLCGVLVDVPATQGNEDMMSAVAHLRDIENEIQCEIGDREDSARSGGVP